MDDPNGCELELKEKMEKDLKTHQDETVEKPCEATKNEELPSTAKKIKP